MVTEIEPHIRYIYSGEPTVEIRSPDCPEELNPFGEIPFEAELIKEDLAKIRASFLNEIGSLGEKTTPAPEGNVIITNTSGKPLQIEIGWHQPPAEDRGEFGKNLFHRFKLYGNNVASKQVIDLSLAFIKGHIGVLVVSETILSQEFVTADHLLPLNYALRALQQSH